MSQSEEELAQKALEAKDPQGEPLAAPAELGEMERDFVELTGLLAWQVDEAEPPPELKASVMQHVRAQAQAADPASNVVAFGERAAAPAPPAWTAWAAAAGLLLAFAFAISTGFLYAQLQSQGDVVASLETRLEEMQQERDLVGFSQASFEDMQRRYAVMTSHGAEVCTLRPAGDNPSQPKARALFWTDPETRSWVLSARNLERCELGREYRIWFESEDGAISGGAFRVKDETERIEIGADEIPAGTKAVMVTLEFPDRVGEEPGGELVLYGDDARQIL